MFRPSEIGEAQAIASKSAKYCTFLRAKAAICLGQTILDFERTLGSLGYENKRLKGNIGEELGENLFLFTPFTLVFPLLPLCFLFSDAVSGKFHHF